MWVPMLCLVLVLQIYACGVRLWCSFLSQQLKHSSLASTYSLLSWQSARPRQMEAGEFLQILPEEAKQQRWDDANVRRKFLAWCSLTDLVERKTTSKKIKREVVEVAKGEDKPVEVNAMRVKRGIFVARSPDLAGDISYHACPTACLTEDIL